MDPKKRYDNSGAAFEADVNDLFNIPDLQDPPPEETETDETDETAK